jgi:hypothetical protein
MVSATDIHAATSSIFGKHKFYRDMTLIFAKDKSEKSIKKALLSQRTLGYCGGNIIGEESLLAKFFQASVTAKYIATSKKGVQIALTNHTSFDYTLLYNGVKIALPAFRTIKTTIKDENVAFTVENMIHVDYQHPTITLKLTK